MTWRRAGKMQRRPQLQLFAPSGAGGAQGLDASPRLRWKQRFPSVRAAPTELTARSYACGKCGFLEDNLGIRPDSVD